MIFDTFHSKWTCHFWSKVVTRKCDLQYLEIHLVIELSIEYEICSSNNETLGTIWDLVISAIKSLLTLHIALSTAASERGYVKNLYKNGKLKVRPSPSKEIALFASLKAL